ncbi:hypothetical protein ACFV6E_21300 [Streptomyces sp. NPDC059785]|uniref:hypothetical protein n=1 Tax=Streptomyces sp. NPDC059785 TaxID=3346945 RepID=UPI0036679649
MSARRSDGKRPKSAVIGYVGMVLLLAVLALSLATGVASDLTFQSAFILSFGVCAGLV